MLPRNPDISEMPTPLKELETESPEGSVEPPSDYCSGEIGTQQEAGSLRPCRFVLSRTPDATLLLLCYCKDGQ